MTREELLKKVAAKNATEEDLFTFFNVKNMEGLEGLLYTQTSVEEINDANLYGGFKLIYSSDDYNPLKEDYLFYFIAIQSLYPVNPDDISLISNILGYFKTTLLLKNLLDEKPIIAYYRNLYNNYVQHQESMAIIANNLAEVILKKLEQMTTDLKEMSIEEIAQKLGGVLKQLT